MSGADTQPDTAARVPRPPRRFLTAAGIVVFVAVAVGLVLLMWPTPHGPAVLHAGTSHYVVTATVEKPSIGATAVEIELAGRTAGPAIPAAVEIEAVMPLMGQATPPVMAVPVGGGRYRAEGVPLMMTGSWELLVSIDVPGGADHLMLPLSVSG